MSFKILQQIIVGALSLGLIFFFIQPKLAEIRTEQAKIEEYRKAVENATEYNQLLSQFINQINAISRADVAALERFLPVEVDTVSVARDLNAIAQQNNLLVRTIEVTEDDGAFTGFVQNIQAPVSDDDPDSAPRAVVNPEADLVAHDITIELVGSYDNFKDFLVATEGNAYPLFVTEFVVGNIEDDEFAAGVMIYNVTLRTFAQVDNVRL